jgi:hypothetical protein
LYQTVCQAVKVQVPACWLSGVGRLQSKIAFLYRIVTLPGGRQGATARLAAAPQRRPILSGKNLVHPPVEHVDLM